MSNTCPCCSEVLLRHIRPDGVYWFCQHCRQEMPNFSDNNLESHHRLPTLLDLSRPVRSLNLPGQSSRSKKRTAEGTTARSH